ncbi:MAG: hypothetical protein FWE25_01845 [Lachnospiraceae bacterium]|nr:hypothetical protein [Lachnospiraceae bacterium]
MDFSFRTFFAQLDYLDGLLGISALLQLRDRPGTLLRNELIAVVVVLVLGLLLCFVGLVLLRFWSAVIGLLLGGAVGLLGTSFFTTNQMVLFIVGAVLGLALAFFLAWRFKLGAFFTAMVLAAGFFINILEPNTWMMYLICLGIGLVAAMITLRYTVPVVVIAAAIFGSMVVAEAVKVIFNFDQMIYIIILAVLAVGGILSQLLFENGKRKRADIQTAKEVAEEHSRGSEVEKLRDVLNSIEKTILSEDKEEPEVKEKSERKEKSAVKEEPVAEKEAEQTATEKEKSVVEQDTEVKETTTEKEETTEAIENKEK